MKLIQTIALHTDHSFYGDPIETTTIELYAAEELIALHPEAIELLKEVQRKELLSRCKRMPHRFWRKMESPIH